MGSAIEEIRKFYSLLQSYREFDSFYSFFYVLHYPHGLSYQDEPLVFSEIINSEDSRLYGIYVEDSDKDYSFYLGFGPITYGESIYLDVPIIRKLSNVKYSTKWIVDRTLARPKIKVFQIKVECNKFLDSVILFKIASMPNTWDRIKDALIIQEE